VSFAAITPYVASQRVFIVVVAVAVVVVVVVVYFVIDSFRKLLDTPSYTARMVGNGRACLVLSELCLLQV
jgi:uncharacterized protein HemY